MAFTNGDGSFHVTNVTNADSTNFGGHRAADMGIQAFPDGHPQPADLQVHGGPVAASRTCNLNGGRSLAVCGYT